MAHAVQKPGEKPEVAVILRGGKGTGKSLFATMFGRIFGAHFLHISQQSQILGRFNSHLKECILLFADEAFACDKQAQAVQKALITEKTIAVEPKGRDIFTVANYIRLIIAGNEPWIIPAGLEERRYFVLDVRDKHRQDHDFFKRMVRQMENGGLEAMMHDLLRIDISKVNLRIAPKTRALMDQVEYGMSPVEKFWYQILQDGALPDEPGWPAYFITARLYENYIRFCDRLNIRGRAAQTIFSRELKKLCPGMKKGRKQLANGRAWVYFLPRLKDCRKAVEDAAGMKPDWDDVS